MNKTYISELSNGREAVCFPMESTLKDLLISLMENWKIHNFYFVDGKEVLQAVVRKNRLLEYLAPLYAAVTIDGEYNRALENRLARVQASQLFADDFTCLTPGLLVPEALALFVESGMEYLPLTDNRGRLIGEVSADSLIKALPVGSREHLYAV